MLVSFMILFVQTIIPFWLILFVIYLVIVFKLPILITEKTNYSSLVVITSGESNSWSCVCVCLAGVSSHPSVCTSIRTHIWVTTGKNFLIFGHDDGLWSGNDACSLKIVDTVWYPKHTDKNVCFWKRFQCYKDTQQ